jgi:hypothetical protein
MKHSIVRVVVLAAAVSMSIATVASAQPIREETVSQQTEIVNNFCDVAGLTVQRDSTINSRVLINTPGRDGLPHTLEHLRITTVNTNLANGDTTTLVETLTQKELRVTDNGDGTLTLIVFVTGTSVLLDSEGKVIARDSGPTRVEVLFDHGGTPNDRSDDIFINDVIVRDSGLSEDFCAVGLAN